MADDIPKLEDLDPETIELFNKLHKDLLLIMLARLGGTITVSADEIDSADRYKMMTTVDSDNRQFVFELKTRE
jgi:hypothetical protein